MGPSRRMRERPVRRRARLRDRALTPAVAKGAHGGHEMPAPRPRAGCDPPRGHGNAGGVASGGRGQNLVRFSRIFAALEPKWQPPKRGPGRALRLPSRQLLLLRQAPHVRRAAPVRRRWRLPRTELEPGGQRHWSYNQRAGPDLAPTARGGEARHGEGRRARENVVVRGKNEGNG